MIVRWTLTEKDVLPILLRFTSFGSKWYAEVILEDKTTRTLDELYQPKGLKIILE
jgi:hypothetical protein